MLTKDVYEDLVDMLDQSYVGVPKTPELMKILRLQYTISEARLAVQVGLSGGKLNEISEKTAIEEGKLKSMLTTMADKGTMWISPGKDDPNYRATGVAGPGIVDTSAWGNVRFPHTVQVAKLLHKFQRDWAKEKLCNVASPVGRVWPGTSRLPQDAEPSENIAEVIKQSGHWSVSTCSCRLPHWIADPGNHCKHLLETCLLMGNLSRWCVEHGMARELTYDQAAELLRKCNEDGLVHTCDPLWNVCNCCTDCCVLLIGLREIGAPLLERSDFVAQIDEERCTACGTCADRCPVDAIDLDGFAAVKDDLCIGCGVCVSTCQAKSANLVRRPKVGQAQVSAQA